MRRAYRTCLSASPRRAAAAVAEAMCRRSSSSDSISVRYSRTCLIGRSQTTLTNQARWLQLSLVSSYV